MLGLTLSPPRGSKLDGVDSRSLTVLAAATACSFLPLSISHIVSLIFGALLFLGAQALSPTVERERATKGKVKACSARRGSSLKLQDPARSSCGGCEASVPRSASHAASARPVPRAVLASAAAGSPAKPEVWKPSVRPVQAPTFTCQGWDAEVQELLSQLTPTAETSEAIAKIAQAVRGAVAHVLPGAEVTGFVGASLDSGKAFNVAVPEVEVVISASSAALVQNRWQGKQRCGECTAQQLRKSAVRACTDRLVADGGFKFRRSAFRGDEPKVTIVSPPELRSVPMNLSVNALTPLFNAVLVAECARMDARVQGLILLVKRWAKDRGLCHVARGHLSMYSWTVMSVYFLQAGAGAGILPPLECLETPSGLAVRARPGFETSSAVLPDLSVGDLFKAFVRFYTMEFDWRCEAVSVRSGKRAAPDPRLPLHIIVGSNGKATEVGPSIEDPFDETKNLGAGATTSSLQHLRKEFRRAHDACAAAASLSELLLPWSPDCSEDASEE